MPRAPGLDPEQNMQTTTTRRGSKAGERLTALTFLGPGTLFLLVFMAIPVGVVIASAFFTRGRFGGVVWDFTPENFARLADPLYLGIVGQSLLMAGAVTIAALVISYPVAYGIAKLPTRWATIALILVILPFWTNFLIRTYAWMLLLNKTGFFNQILEGIGLIAEPLDLLYNRGAVFTGLLYMYLPLMILPLYASLQQVDRTQLEAATNLGGSPWRVFRTITLPLSLPGALTGAIFVFVPSMSNFVIPELLGGGKMVLIGNVVRDQFLEARDWPFGSAVALVLTTVLVALILLQSAITNRVAKGGRNAA